MTTPLAALPSTAPLPTGDVKTRWSSGGGGYVWPANQAPFTDTSGVMQVGPWVKPWRYWLIVMANIIVTGPAAWTRQDFALRLLDQNGAAISDLNGINFFQKITVRDSEGGGWQGYTINGHFFCEANQLYSVQLQSWSAPASGYSYYAADVHLSLFGHTIGEGVY